MDGLFYSEELNNCIEISVENCKTINLNTEICEECNEGFYLSNDGCQPIPRIKDCIKYNQFNFQCLQCDRNSLLTTYKSCEPVSNTINNCQHYDANGECIECFEGFYLPNCYPIIFNENCIKKKNNQNKCEKCKTGSLMYNEECYQTQNLATETCLKESIDLTVFPFTCSVCKQNSKLMTITSKMHSCKIEQFQNHFTGKCIKFNFDIDSKGLYCF